MTDLEACRALLDKLSAGGTVNNTELQQALGAEHWQTFQQSCQTNQMHRDNAVQAKTGLSEYTKRLNIADMRFGLQELRDRKPKDATRPQQIKADYYYERALERLDELLNADRSLQQYLDRPFDYDDVNGVHCSPDAHSMPINIYHKGRENRRLHHVHIPTQKELKQEALENAIENPSNKTQQDLDDEIASSYAPANKSSAAEMDALRRLSRRNR